MVKDQIAREETRCRHMGYSFRLTARIDPTTYRTMSERSYRGATSRLLMRETRM